MKAQDYYLYMYPALILLVLLSFFLVAGDVRYRANAMDQAAFDISENAAPSIMYLSAARSEVRQLLVQVERVLDQAGAGGPGAGEFVPTAEIRNIRRRIHQQAQLYQDLPVFPGERAIWEQGNRALSHLDGVVERFLSLFEQRRIAEAERLAHTELSDSATETVDAFMVTIEFDAQQSHYLGQRLRELRKTLVDRSLVISTLGALWTIMTVLIITFSIRRRAQQQEAERRFALERADALERFAAEVAHDILNPLSTVSYALAGLELTAAGEQRSSLLGRGISGANRVRQIVDGLLKFASAGARPEPNALTDVRGVLTELQAELVQQAAAADIDLRTEPCAPVHAACHPGILTSLVSNLAHNAIKYMGDSPERRITIRVIEHGHMLRFEVEDTGPGLLPGLEKTVFDPYVRGRHGRQPGFGLGLATVKKAAEAHGGAVGVRSKIGSGCLFWFELPKGHPGQS